MGYHVDLPEIIPVFPLPGALLLPRARLPLHIFEPRYLAMIDDTLKTTERLVGLVQPREVPGSQEEKLHAIGCAGRLTTFSETDDNRYMITLTGISRYRIVQTLDAFQPYRRCKVAWGDFTADTGNTEVDKGFDRSAFLALLQRYFEEQQLSTDWGSLKQAEDEMLINSLAMVCPFTPEDKQALLEAPSLTNRRETLVTLLEFALRGGNGEDRLQ